MSTTETQADQHDEAESESAAADERAADDAAQVPATDERAADDAAQVPATDERAADDAAQVPATDSGADPTEESGADGADYLGSDEDTEPAAAGDSSADPDGDPVQVPATDSGADPAEELLLQLEEEPAAGEVVIDDVTMRRALEAILMVTDEPLPALVLARAVGRPVGDVTGALKELAGEYTEQGRGFDLREVGGGWRYYTRPAEAQYVEKFVLDGQQARLTQAALETLAVVAYKQPVSRARVSAIRGVNVDGVMRTLISRGLVEDAGADTESQATLYRTSSYFLERMGMQSLDDLPELAPYLPEMDDMEEELAAQSTATAEDLGTEGTGTPDAATPPEAVGTPGPAEAVTSDVGAAGIDGDLSTTGDPQLDLEHEEPELEPAEELEAGGDTELDQEEADPAEIPETGGDSEDGTGDDAADDSDDDGVEIVVPEDDDDDDDEDDLVDDDSDDEDDDHLESAEELTEERTAGDVGDTEPAQYRVRSDD
ncbi:SMC-Scp complex subunit ScpB [Kribbella italica]|uniref:SMC-Scp complex subunit ScpB n=1 Tax=Kribbella italica TaxID=1540520 RepID=UPI00307FFF7E